MRISGASVNAYRAALDTDEGLQKRRGEQARSWMWSEISESLIERLLGDVHMKASMEQLESAVVSGIIPATTAAARILAAVPPFQGLSD